MEEVEEQEDPVEEEEDSVEEEEENDTEEEKEDETDNSVPRISLMVLTEGEGP